MRLTLVKKLTPVLIGLVSITLMGFAFAAPPMPDIPKGKGEQCVEPTQEMRINHMEKLKHQRDLTVIEGVRTKKHSLNECIACHVVPDSKGEFPKIGTDQHFCSTCHNYASVKVDCFQCHATKPEESGSMHGMTGENPHHSSEISDDNNQLSQRELDIVTSEIRQ